MKSDKAANEVGRATNDDRRMETPNGFGEEGVREMARRTQRTFFSFLFRRHNSR